MFHIIPKISLAAMALMLSACGATFDTDALRHQTDNRGNFSAELGRAYKKFAISEIDVMVDWIDGVHFGRKAKLAFADKSPQPEEIDNWWLTKNQKRTFKDARKRLLHSLNKHSKKQIPSVAAAAQFNFDCWIEQQEENWQTTHIEKCRKGFYAAIESLEEFAELARSQYLVKPKSQAGSHTGSHTGQKTKGRIVPARQTLIDPRSKHETRTYTLYFSFDKSELDQGGKNQIERVVREYRAGAPVTIVLAGHADRSGKKPYNLVLSRERSEAVRRQLIKSGIPVQMIEAHAFGEMRPRKGTQDGKREPANRRVEITVGPVSTL